MRTVEEVLREMEFVLDRYKPEILRLYAQGVERETRSDIEYRLQSRADKARTNDAEDVLRDAVEMVRQLPSLIK